jgi:DNA-binding NarL/FixJ family response regulator
MATKPRILAAGGRRLVVGTLAKLLETRFEIVGTAADSKELVEVASRLNPDLVILDRRLQDAGDELRELLPNTKQIVLTMDEDYELEAVSLEGCVSGFPLKSPAGRKLILTIGKVLKGTSNITPETPQKAFDRFLRDLRANREKHLTPRQRDVLRLLAEGHTMKEAAEVLHVTTRTIAFHKYTMMEAFGLKTNSDLFRFAIKNRVITVF